MVSTPGPSKAEDESRRVRKYENTKGGGVSVVGMGEETWRSRGRRRPSGCPRPAPNKQLLNEARQILDPMVNTDSARIPCRASGRG